MPPARAKSSPANVLDLTCKQTLFELAIEEGELIGRAGAKLVGELKERAAETEYTHVCFRDPIRPGIVWFIPVGPRAAPGLPTRGRLDHCRAAADRVFPGLLERMAGQSDAVVMSEIPPLPMSGCFTSASGASGLELATALEYVVFVHPAMVRAWAALIFTYDEMLSLKESAQSVRAASIGSCPYAQLVPYLLGEPLNP